eukprot:gene9004-biopygen1637
MRPGKSRKSPTPLRTAPPICPSTALPNPATGVRAGVCNADSHRRSGTPVAGIPPDSRHRAGIGEVGGWADGWRGAALSPAPGGPRGLRNR